MKKLLTAHAGILGLLIAAALAAQTQPAQYVISSFAGAGGPQTPIAGLSASIGQASSVAADGFGNIYFGSDFACVFKQDSTGILTRIAGTCRPGFSGDGGPAAQAQLAAGPNVAVDSAGNLYIADRSNQRVRKVLPDGTITTIAGSGNIVPNGGDGGPATQAQLGVPAAIAFDSAGNMYIGERDGLRKVTPDGTISTLAGGDIGFPYGVAGVAVDSAGNIFVTEPQRNQVRKITTGVVSAPIYFEYPQGLALDPAGNLYIAEHDNNSITVLAPDGSRMLVAGSCGLTGPGLNLCVGGFAGDGGPATKATLGFPLGVAVSQGNLYIADTGNRRIRKVSANGVINTISGNGNESYSGDGGPASKAQLWGPSGAAIDAAGNLYFADSNNERIRKISLAGTITTVAGNGTPGFSGDGGPAVSAQLKPRDGDQQKPEWVEHSLRIQNSLSRPRSRSSEISHLQCRSSFSDHTREPFWRFSLRAVFPFALCISAFVQGQEPRKRSTSPSDYFTPGLIDKGIAVVAGGVPL
jgi:sugar lactone lactonase YvrE